MSSYYPDPQAEASIPTPRLYDAHVDIVIDGALVAARGDVFGDDTRRRIDAALDESGRRFCYSAHIPDIPFDGRAVCDNEIAAAPEWQPSETTLRYMREEVWRWRR